MAAEVDTGMPKADLKKLLKASGADNPVRVAAALHKDTKIAYLRISKIGNAKALGADLKKDFPEIKLATFGSAMSAEEDHGPEIPESHKGDPKLAVFRLEKPLSGLGKRLKNTLKGTGFSKVIVIYEDGSSDADVAEEEEAEAGASPSAAAQPAAAQPAAAPPPAPPAPPSAAPQAPAQDAGALGKRLAHLIPQIATADAATKPALAKLAGDANTNLKSGNLAAATVFVEELEAKLGQAPASGTAPAAPAAPASPAAKSRQIWLATRKKLQDDLQKLHDNIAATYKDHIALSEIESSYRTRIAPVLATLNDELAEKLEELAGAAPDAHDKILADTKAVITRYQTFLGGEPLLAELDDNPFVPLALRDTVGKTLAAITATVH
jgi:hypothetical protein